MTTAKNCAACRNTSQAVKLNMYCSIYFFQAWFKVTSNETQKVMSHDKINLLRDKNRYLVFVACHRLNACDISTSACDKVQLIHVCRQNHALYHILNIAQPYTFQYITLKVYYYFHIKNSAFQLKKQHIFSKKCKENIYSNY